MRAENLYPLLKDLEEKEKLKLYHHLKGELKMDNSLEDKDRDRINWLKENVFNKPEIN
jgi:hypothetical protein